MVNENALQINAVLGIFKAHRDGEDIILPNENQKFITLRQQTSKTSSQPNLALADFISPNENDNDHVGCFAVSAGFGLDKIVIEFEKNHDDYNSILAKALADRLAEAFAELMHHRVRTDLWAYATDEMLTNDQMINEEYRGIRPAPGYPACPAHEVKKDLLRVIGSEDIGMTLTESMAMNPASSVSGFYLAHPDARYFNVGKLSADQIEDLAKRRNESVEDIRRQLASSID
jgi:5-methyltetrahydrofolate--homocysteine methyltransferase